MEFTAKSSSLVRPAAATWSGCIPLSEFDQTGILTDVQLVYFYRPPHHCLSPADPNFTTFRDALSRALVHFYPFAARLRPLPGARIHLHCNNAGALLIRADSDLQLDDLGDLLNSPPYLEHLIPQVDYVSLPLEEIPLLSVQFTRFRCGAVALGFAMSHVVADGHSGVQFLTGLAKLARGEPLGDLPCFDTKLLRAGEEASGPPRFHHVEYDPPRVLIGESDGGKKQREKKTTDVLLKLSKAEVEAIKAEANRVRPKIHATRTPYSRYESIAAHAWRCACNARRHAKDQPAAMIVTADIRRRMVPPLPRTYFFCGILQAIAGSSAGDVTEEPLGYVAGKVRAAIDGVTSEYVESAIDYLKGLKDLSYYQDIHTMKSGEGPFYGNPNVGVISWMGLSLEGLDLGWGREVFMAPRTHDCDGDVFILQSRDGDGSVIVAVCLQEEFMKDFKRLFYSKIPRAENLPKK